MPESTNMRHLMPDVQRQAARMRHPGDGTAPRSYRLIAEALGLRNAAAATHAAFYGREQLGIPQPRRVRADGATEVATATGWMVLTERRWGVEVEMAGLNVSDAAEALRDAGLDVEERHGWTAHGSRRGHDRPTIKVEPDGSPGVSAEAVLPPVSGDEGVSLLTNTMTALREQGARVTSGCGMHVHVDIGDFDETELLALVDLWAEVQSTVYRFVPAGRRSSRWCPANTSWDLDNYRTLIRDGELNQRATDRYRGLNLDSYRHYGTVEFRIHGGTLNATKARHWVALCVSLVEAASRGTVVDGASPDALLSSLAAEALLPEGTEQYLSRRAAALT
jgi:hypothetical protein